MAGDTDKKTMTIALATAKAFPSLHQEEHALVPLLAERGVHAVRAIWNDPRIDWQQFDAVVVRSTWDYHYHLDAFLEWIDTREQEGVPLLNPPKLLRMSVDKSYLVDLARQGWPTVPTILVTSDDPTEIDEYLRDLGCEEAVLKPTVGASGFRAVRVHRREVRTAQKRLEELKSYGDLLIQPFLSSVTSEGEWSLIYIGGKYSHAVLKWPASNDFRVQEEWGGRTERRDPPPSVRDVADRLLDQLGVPTLYARIDGFMPSAQSARKGLLLSEVELVEPLLFLSHQPGSLEKFADAIAARVAVGTRS